MVSNAALYYKKPPHGAPVPGETLQRVVDDNFDVDNVPLNGGILVQSKVSGWICYEGNGVEAC